MLAQVVPVAVLVREVDPADEGDPIVDDDRLLVVAVKWPFARIELALDPRALCELVSHSLDLAPGRAEERERSAGPDEDPDVESLGQLREQIAKDERGSLPHERKVGREVPAGDVHVRARRLQRIGDRGQRVRSVDEDLDRVAGPWRRRTLGPAVTFRVQSALPAKRAQAPGVVRGDLLRDDLADEGFARHEPAADALPEALRGAHER